MSGNTRRRSTKYRQSSEFHPNIISLPCTVQHAKSVSLDPSHTDPGLGVTKSSAAVLTLTMFAVAPLPYPRASIDLRESLGEPQY
jgi:hypothetical protein